MLTTKQEPNDSLANLTMFSAVSNTRTTRFKNIDKLQFFEKKFAPELDMERNLKRRNEQTLDKLDYFSEIQDLSKTNTKREKVDFHFGGMQVQSTKSLRNKHDRKKRLRQSGTQILGGRDQRDKLLKKWEMQDPRKIDRGTDSMMKKVDMAYERLLKREIPKF